MQKQNGNFLLQALLALTLVFAFMPFFANKLSSRDMEARLYSVAEQVDTIHKAARIFLRDEFKNNYPNGTVTFVRNPSTCPEGYNCQINAVLEPFGVPMGFNPRTVFNQDISLIATREVVDDNIVVSGYVKLSRGDLNDKNLEWAQLLRMLGLYASFTSDRAEIHVAVPVEEIYTDVVLRHETGDDIFLTRLDMGGCVDSGGNQTNCNIDGIGGLYANRAVAGTSSVYNLVLSCEDTDLDSNGFCIPIEVKDSGSELSLNAKYVDFLGRTALSPDIANIADKTSLSLSGANVDVKNWATINQLASLTAALSIGDEGYLNMKQLSIVNVEGYDYLDLSFKDSGNVHWTFNGPVYLDGLQYFDVNGDVDASYVIGMKGLPDGGYQPGEKGVTASNVLYAQGINVYKNISDVAVAESVSDGGDFKIEMTSVPSKLPDILIDGLNNDDIRVITNPCDKKEGNGIETFVDTIQCGKVFDNIPTVNIEISKNSLVDNIICQYLFYNRIERRLNEKLYNKRHNVCSQ